MSMPMLVVIVPAALVVMIATFKAPRLMGAMLWSLAATIMASSALLATLPISFAELALWLAIAVSPVWVGLIFWCYWASTAWVVTLFLVILTIASALILFLQ